MLLGINVSLMAQNQFVADSLEQVFLSVEDPVTELNLLKDLTIAEMDQGKKLKYSKLLVDLAKSNDSLHYLLFAYQSLGNYYMNIGDYTASLENFSQAAKHADKNGGSKDLSLTYMSIGSVYASKKEYRMSIQYLNKSKSLLENLDKLNRVDSVRLANTLENLGFSYVGINKPDSAFVYLDRSGQFYESLNFPQGIAYNIGNKGLAYAEKGDHEKAISFINEAIALLEELKDYWGISELLNNMSELFIDLENYEKAEIYAQGSLSIAKTQGLKDVISSTSLNLSQIYEITGDSVASYRFYKDHIAYRDSVIDLASVAQMASIRADFEVSQKQLEVDLLNNQKRTQRIIMYSLGFFLLLTFLYYRRIEKEKNRSDLLLLNILPSKTAKELKDKGKVEARKFEAVTVMFTDFQAFTRHSQDLSPEKLVKSVDHFFSAFDKIIEKHGLEKIKTIGDAYMCTGGLISRGPMEPVNVINAAFEIIDFVKKERESDSDEIAHFDIRIGINTGPVVGGVVGTKKFAYDIWGDTVNVAARMESNSKPGRINISENTYQLVKDRFQCKYRGEIDVKNKGMMKMYFVLNPNMKKDLNNNKTEATEKKEISFEKNLSRLGQ